jgi:drug/metabolite transporter (DMT)-like permease
VQCTVWVGTSILTQSVYEQSSSSSSENNEDDDRDRVPPPFVLTYIGMSVLALLLPIRHLLDQWRRRRRAHATALQQRLGRSTTTNSTNNDDPTSINACDSKTMRLIPCIDITPAPSFDTVDAKWSIASDLSDYLDITIYSTHQLAVQKEIKQWNHRRHLWAALLLTPAMFLADWSFNMALLRTSVPSATVLVSMQSVFCFLLAVLTHLEAFSAMKLVGVVVCVVGTALTTVDDMVMTTTTSGTGGVDQNLTNDVDNGNHTLLVGDALALLAALLYAAYTIQVRIFCPENETLYSMPLLLGYIGMLCLVVLAPVGAYVIYHHAASLTPYVLAMIVLKGLLDFCITEYCLIKAICLTNATVATVGLGLTIPLAFLANWAMGKTSMTDDDGDDFAVLGSTYGLLGAVAVAIGFVVVNVAPDDHHPNNVVPPTTPPNHGNAAAAATANATEPSPRGASDECIDDDKKIVEQP